jgi:hypothetical protein
MSVMSNAAMFQRQNLPRSSVRFPFYGAAAGAHQEIEVATLIRLQIPIIGRPSKASLGSLWLFIQLR